jgi:hypothetical protein
LEKLGALLMKARNLISQLVVLFVLCSCGGDKINKNDSATESNSRGINHFTFYPRTPTKCNADAVEHAGFCWYVAQSKSSLAYKSSFVGPNCTDVCRYRGGVDLRGMRDYAGAKAPLANCRALAEDFMVNAGRMEVKFSGSFLVPITNAWVKEYNTKEPCGILYDSTLHKVKVGRGSLGTDPSIRSTWYMPNPDRNIYLFEGRSYFCSCNQ